jgi:hypothetical protein
VEGGSTEVRLIVDYSATDDNDSQPSTGFNGYIITNTKIAVANQPEGRSVKRIPLCIGSQHQHCITMHIKYNIDNVGVWKLK